MVPANRYAVDWVESTASSKLATRLNPTLEFYGNQLMSGRPQAELNELDADTLPELPHITLPLDLDIRLSAGDIKCLEPFVTFEGADNA